ncbi:E3 ubiquitin-protein ligase WAVH1-like [Amaranthus tricolor]|uniref:E3 ubiquitin-protein ligase WAVH1-like n=1 Tax=Amaranthus tricolor TaxID=29722 RepID=UPI00259069B4|nr:E3 ubiquitin-protein ligase WAVH1-like [Amaranthus tricolor]
MVTGWRRAFCTSIPKDPEPNTTPNHTTNRSPKLGFSKFTFFSSSSPSTLRPQTPTSAPKTPTLRCKTSIDETSSKLKCKTPPPSSPQSVQSPSSFSLLLKNSLRFSKLTRCGVCLHNVKAGQGTAIFTAECSHSFHFPCISNLATKTNGVILSCPLCGSQWKETPYLAVTQKSKPIKKSIPTDLRLYDDDEPLVTHVSSIQFNPIPESEEENEPDDDQFPGFFSDPVTPRPQNTHMNKGVDVTISPESTIIAVGRTYETYAVLLTVKAPTFPGRIRRPSVDVVVVLDIGCEINAGKLNSLKRSMKGMISSLSSNDRLSMVAFSSTSKRLLPLRRMTPSGRRSARKIIDAINIAPSETHSSGNNYCLNDALKKAAKIIQDRKEKNHFTSIILMDGQDEKRETNDQFLVSSTRFSEIPVHTFKIKEGFSEEEFVKTVNQFLSVVVLDVRFQIGLATGSAAADIVAVYSCTGRPGLLGSGSAKLGDLYSGEERELLVELKVPASSIGSHHMLSVRSYHKDPSFCKQVIYGGDQSLIVPRPHTIRSSDPKIQRLRSLFVMTRAVAESRRLLAERNDFVGAERLLGLARAVLSQRSLKVAAAGEYRRRVEAELAEVKWRRQTQQEETPRREKEGSNRNGGGCCVVDEKGEPLTPTSAWKAAERLAKVAMMRKNLNRVSDLHGFEDARF